MLGTRDFVHLRTGPSWENFGQTRRNDIGQPESRLPPIPPLLPCPTFWSADKPSQFVSQAARRDRRRLLVKRLIYGCLPLTLGTRILWPTTVSTDPADILLNQSKNSKLSSSTGQMPFSSIPLSTNLTANRTLHTVTATPNETHHPSRFTLRHRHSESLDWQFLSGLTESGAMTQSH